jgi:hypothetical protein
MGLVYLDWADQRVQYPLRLSHILPLQLELAVTERKLGRNSGMQTICSVGGAPAR